MKFVVTGFVMVVLAIGFAINLQRRDTPSVKNQDPKIIFDRIVQNLE
jgi:hypothetical protein